MGNAALIHNLQSVTAADSSICYDGSDMSFSKKQQKKNPELIRRRLTQRKIAEDLTQRLENEFGYKNVSSRRGSIFNAKPTAPIHAKVSGMFGNMILKKTSPKREIPTKKQNKKNNIKISDLEEKDTDSLDQKIQTIKFDVESLRNLAQGASLGTNRSVLESYRAAENPI